MARPTPDELRQRITGLAPGERPAMNPWLAAAICLVIHARYRRR